MCASWPNEPESRPSCRSPPTFHGRRASSRDRASQHAEESPTRVPSLALDVAIVSGVSLVLGLIRLGAPALWYDEAYTYRQIHKSYIEQFEGYQPFYYWIQKPWTSLAGTSEWAMRFPSVVGAMLASALLVVLARKLFDRRIALLSGLFLATSPYFVKWSQQARAYPLLVAGSLVATLLLLRALDRDSRSAWAMYGIAYAVLLVSHAVVVLLLLPVHAVLIVQRRERVLPHGLLAGVIVARDRRPLGRPARDAHRDSETSETAWIPFPSAEYVTRALLGSRASQGSAFSSRPSASGRCADGEERISRCGSGRGRSAPMRARARHLDREADLPRPLPRDRGASVRDARGRRRDGSRRPASRRSRRRRGSRHSRRARALVLVGGGRQLARGGLAKRRRDRGRATRRGRCGRRRALVDARCGGVLRRPRRRRVDGGLDLGPPLVGGGSQSFRPTFGVLSASAITCWSRGFSSAGG